MKLVTEGKVVVDDPTMAAGFPSCVHPPSRGRGLPPDGATTGGLRPVPAWCIGELGAFMDASSRDEGFSGTGPDRSAMIARSTVVRPDSRPQPRSSIQEDELCSRATSIAMPSLDSTTLASVKSGSKKSSEAGAACWGDTSLVEDRSSDVGRVPAGPHRSQSRTAGRRTEDRPLKGWGT